MAGSLLPSLITPAHAGIWAITIAVIFAVLFRPRRLDEAVSAIAGAILLVVLGLLPWRDAAAAAARGSEVYLFLVGMMLLAETARVAGVFDWAAVLALRTARGSRTRLFVLLYGVGIVVTALLSNDATAVVLTPAVYAAVRRTDASPVPYLFSCAFIANAASFILPISNPANLVVFGSHLPPLRFWVTVFGVPALIAVVVTFFSLYAVSRAALHGTFESNEETAPLGLRGNVALAAVLFSAAVLVTLTWFHVPIGGVTLALGLAGTGLLTAIDRRSARAVLSGVSWGIVPLVAGLFVIVAALERSGALELLRHLFTYAQQFSHVAGNVLIGGIVGAVCNVLNNLPMGLIASSVVAGRAPPAAHLVHATLVGVDLGPNLSVTGSLATLLWLAALRREGVDVTPGRFFRTGVAVTVPSLFLALLAVR